MNLFYRKPDYVRQEGSIRYLDSENLSRPISMPRAQQAIMAAFVVIGIIVGVNLYQGTVGAAQQTQQLSQTSVEENLARPVTYDLPVLTELAGCDNEEILDAFTSAGYTIYNQTEEGSEGLSLIKLPSDVTLADAATLYAKGVSSLSASDASRLLNGSWSFSLDRSDGESYSVKYADFSSSSIEAAIASAIATEGFDPATTPEGGSGTDEVGNTYQTGTVEVGDTTYTWRISATALSNKYSVSGLPDSAVYVGIRMSA